MNDLQDLTREELADTWLDSCDAFNRDPETDVENRLTDISLNLHILLCDYNFDALTGDLTDAERIELNVIETALYDLRLSAHPSQRSIKIHNDIMTNRLEYIETIRQTDLAYEEADTGIEISMN